MNQEISAKNIPIVMLCMSRLIVGCNEIQMCGDAANVPARSSSVKKYQNP